MAAMWRVQALVVSVLSLSPAYAEDQRHTDSSDTDQRQTRQESSGGIQNSTETHERAISQITQDYIPGNRLVTGRVKEIRAQQILIDIGNPQLLYVPLKPANDKGQVFKEGNAVVVTMNDHNAVVTYHHVDVPPEHQVVIGRLVTPLTVGLDKAVLKTDAGERTYRVASRARTKLGAIPIGVEAVFLADETGQLVDAQLTSAEAIHKSGVNDKGKLRGAHERVRAVYKGRTEQSMKVAIGKEGEREMPIRPPLQKLDWLQPNQEIVLLVDDEGYVIEIATPDVPPVR